MKDSTTSQEDDDSEDEGLEEVQYKIHVLCNTNHHHH